MAFIIQYHHRLTNALSIEDFRMCSDSQSNAILLDLVYFLVNDERFVYYNVLGLKRLFCFLFVSYLRHLEFSNFVKY